VGTGHSQNSPLAQLRSVLGLSRVRTLKAGILYFGVVFGAGFVLGPIRILYVEPRIGTRVAELLESPIMFLVSFLAARWIVSRLAVPRVFFQRLTMGGIALALLLLGEFFVVSWIRGLSFRDYVSTRDPVSGTVCPRLRIAKRLNGGCGPPRLARFDFRPQDFDCDAELFFIHQRK